jgi:hypothetical protein
MGNSVLQIEKAEDEASPNLDGARSGDLPDGAQGCPREDSRSATGDQEARRRDSVRAPNSTKSHGEVCGANDDGGLDFVEAPRPSARRGSRDRTGGGSKYWLQGKWRQLLAAAYARREISAKAFIVGIVITNHADNRTGESYPPIARIAELCGWPVTKAGECKTVSRLIKELVGAGLLKVKRQGLKKPNLYIPLVPEGRFDEGAVPARANVIGHLECPISDRSDARVVIGQIEASDRSPRAPDKLIQERTDSESKPFLDAHARKASSLERAVSLRSPDKKTEEGKSRPGSSSTSWVKKQPLPNESDYEFCGTWDEIGRQAGILPGWRLIVYSRFLEYNRGRYSYDWLAQWEHWCRSAQTKRGITKVPIPDGAAQNPKLLAYLRAKGQRSILKAFWRDGDEIRTRD